MTAPPPSSQSPLDELPQVQRFLERAAPLFLDRRQLDENAWAALRDLARQQGLTDQELDLVVASLKRRGVIHEATPKSQSIKEIEIEAEDPDLRLDPTPPPPPVTKTNTPPPPRPTALASSRWAESDERKLFSTFLDRARPILAERRGLDPTTYAMLADIAHSLGLSENQFDEAIHVLCGTRTPPQPPAAPINAQRSSASPHRDGRPDETFRKYLKLAIQDKHRSKGYLSESVERKLVDEGVRKLGLSPVFARHLVHETAQNLGTTVISQQDADNAEKDPQFDQFLSRALPVLAAERGMTTRARLLLMTIAEECGLKQDAVDRAVAVLQHSSESGNTANQWRAERREAFRNDLRRILASTPGGMLPPHSVNDLVWRGTHLYGLDAKTSEDCLIDVGTASGVTMLSPEQAVKSMSALVLERLGARTRLSADDEWEVFTYGEQLGLAEDQLRKIVRDCIQQRRRQRIRERNITGAALIGGGLAVVILLGVFYASLFGSWQWFTKAAGPTDRKGSSETSVAGNKSDSSTDPDFDTETAATSRTTASSESPIPPPESEIRNAKSPMEELEDFAHSRSVASGDEDSSAKSSSGKSATAEGWWDAELSVLLVRARSASPRARKDDLQQLEQGDVENRSAAYERLVPAAIDERGATSTPGPIGNLLIECFVKDTEPAAVDQLLTSLLSNLPAVSAAPPENSVQYNRMFAAIRLLVDTAERTDLAPNRLTQLQEGLTESLAESIVKGTSRGELQQRCCSALLRRIYHNLTQTSSKLAGETIVAHSRSVRGFASTYLTQHEYQKLIVDLLIVGLPSTTNWRDYIPLLEMAPVAEEPRQAQRLLELFEATDDLELKKQLANMLVHYLGADAEETVALEEVPDRVRKSLGDSDVAETVTHDDSLKTFQDEAQAALRSIEVQGSDRSILLQQTSRLAQLVTQGMALARNDLTTFNEARGVVTESTASSATDSIDSAEEGGPGPAPRATGLVPQINVLIDRIKRSKQLDHRLNALELLGSLAPSVSDIHPDVAEALASYYASSRNETEHRQRMLRLTAMKNWNNLRIAIAHEIGNKTGYDFQLEEVVNEFIGERFDAPTDATWTKRARGRLLRDALQQLATATVEEETETSEITLAQLEATFKKQLLIQARLVGIDIKEFKGSDSPADVLHAMTLAQVTALKTKLTDAGQLKQLADIPHRIAAIEYLANNDFERAVRLDRLWIELLGMQLDSELRTSVASEHAADLQRGDLESNGLLEQMRNGQAALVRMWLSRLERPAS